MILEIEVRKGAKLPNRANPSDAGLDVFYCPKDPTVSAISILPGGSQMLATGLKFGVPHGYMLQVCNRSSMGAKRSLVVGAHIIDSGYDGEVFIDLHNIGTEPQYVGAGEKIAQLVLVPVVHFRTIEVEGGLYDESISMSGRGDGALGSTDTKTRATSTAQLDMADKVGKICGEGWLPNGF
tara:strand:- start:243 stop:785 length:543 start_codon:yes stop_codon:yes gene_type:complete